MSGMHQAMLVAGGGGGGGPTWTPAEIFTGSVRGAWYEANDLSTLWQDASSTVPVTTPGDLIYRIDDKSGNGIGLVQGTSGLRFILQNDGTDNYFDMDGSDDYESYNTGADMRLEDDDLNIVIGFRFDNSSGDGTVLARALQNSENGRYWIARFGGDLGIGVQLAGTVYEAKAAFSSTANTVICGYLDRDVANSIAVRINGTTTTGTNATNTANYVPDRRFMLGAFNGPIDNTQVAHLNGRIYAVLIWFAPYDADTMDAAEAWMAGQCGVTL
jgi:hypothetical protein